MATVHPTRSRRSGPPRQTGTTLTLVDVHARNPEATVTIAACVVP
jgi:hypothetical protein